MRVRACARPRCGTSPQLKEGNEWCVPPPRRDTQASPVLATANILAGVPLAELHLRVERSPSLPPRTSKHTTHPTWCVFPFILRGALRSGLGVRAGVCQRPFAVPFCRCRRVSDPAPLWRLRDCLVQCERTCWGAFAPLFFGGGGGLRGGVLKLCSRVRSLHNCATGQRYG